MDLVTDLGAVLGEIVVVGRDRPGAEVDAAPDCGVADVGQVRNLAPLTDRGVLYLDERTDLALGVQRRTRAQVGERADSGAAADDGQRRVGAGDRRVLPHLAVDERRVGSDRRPALDSCCAQDVRVRQHRDVGSERGCHVDPGRGRIQDRRTLELPATDGPRIERAGCFRQLHPVVHAERVLRRRSVGCRDDLARGAEDADDVSQVLLALRVGRAH